MKYIITKEIEAKNLKEALANESKGEVIDVTKKEEETTQSRMGYNT